MRRRLFLFLPIAPFAVAQNTQIGGLIGRGGLAQLFENSAYHVVAGVEACVRCGGRLGVFGEYHHWAKTGVGARSTAVGGGMLGFGAAISLSRHWYVRPFARIVVLSTPEFGGFGGASVGYRF